MRLLSCKQQETARSHALLGGLRVSLRLALTVPHRSCWYMSTELISREHRLITLDRSSTRTYVEQLTTIWAAPPHQSVTELHLVSSPPNDLDISAEATYVVEFASDRQRQADPTDRLVLVGILINKAGATSGGPHVRRVVWSRLFMSRDDTLSLYQLQEFAD